MALLYINILVVAMHLLASNHSLYMLYQYPNIEKHPWYPRDTQLISLLLLRCIIPLDILLVQSPSWCILHIHYLYVGPMPSQYGLHFLHVWLSWVTYHWSVTPYTHYDCTMPDCTACWMISCLVRYPIIVCLALHHLLESASWTQYLLSKYTL